MNPVVQTLMSRLQMKNPQGYSMVNNLIRSGGNPDSFMKQILTNISPDQKQYILNQAKTYGCPDKFLSQLQNNNLQDYYK